ncbi:MAG: FAD-dependent oxidoreductase, partial [Gammaproteobacteria bacterium]|nr:FAD-dependent oxidoreductase [Gammaproteobacteria bacterium]
MSVRLLKYAFIEDHAEQPWFGAAGALRDSYDVVIIGAGGHGLACAYYLAHDHGITNVAVLDRSYLGGGNTGRNTTIIRSNYLTPEGVAFYDASLALFRDLSLELDTNIFYSERGHYTLAHNESTLRTARWRAEVNKHFGIDSEVVDADAVGRAIPGIDLACGGNHAVEGALYHAPGAVARHDAVAWGYARQAVLRGVEIHQHTAVTAITTRGGRVSGVETNRGPVSAGCVLSAVAGETPRVLDMVGLTSPIEIFPLQACVTEPVKPWLDTIVVSGSLHLYVSQSARGEMVMGAALDPLEVHQRRSTFEFVSGLADQILDLFPAMATLKVNRQWAGMADMTPDFAPVMGTTPVDGFYLDAGWGTWGFKATPISGKTMAATIAAGRDHALVAPFNLRRFDDFRLVGE